MSLTVDAHVNFGKATIVTAPSPATSGTTMAVSSGQGALLPAVPFNATVGADGVEPTSTNAEIVRVTAKSGDNITAMTRAQEGSSARTIVVGDVIRASITVKTVTDLETPLGLLAGGQFPLSTADPSSPSEGQIWFMVSTSSSPNGTVDWKIRRNGVTYGPFGLGSF